MRIANTRTWLAVTLVVLMIAGLTAGCSRDAGQDETPGGGSIDAPATGTDATPDGKPTVEQAEAAVLALAQGAYPEMPIESVRVVGIGEDGDGDWWVQAWTSAGAEYEEEQWFVEYTDEAWAYRQSGTGLERTDLPGDISWEDVE